MFPIIWNMDRSRGKRIVWTNCPKTSPINRPSTLLYSVETNLMRGWKPSTKLVICKMNIGTKHLWMYELHVLRFVIRIFCVLCRFIPERYLLEVEVRIVVSIAHSIKLLIAFYFTRNAEKSRISITSIYFSPIVLKKDSSIINDDAGFLHFLGSLFSLACDKCNSP